MTNNSDTCCRLMIYVLCAGGGAGGIEIRTKWPSQLELRELTRGELTSRELTRRELTSRKVTSRKLTTLVMLHTNLSNTQGKRIREKVRVEPPIMAYDQDTGINARLRYSIILGNENGFFEMNGQTGELFLIREIDLEKLASPTLSLQIQASQVDNPFRQALARVDIAVQDINDNSPEVSGRPQRGQDLQISSLFCSKR